MNELFEKLGNNTGYYVAEMEHGYVIDNFFWYYGDYSDDYTGGYN